MSSVWRLYLRIINFQGVGRLFGDFFALFCFDFVNASVIKEIVGHKAAQSFTERVYTHVYIKTKIEAVNTIHT